jgi:hypothetical protein
MNKLFFTLFFVTTIGMYSANVQAAPQNKQVIHVPHTHTHADDLDALADAAFENQIFGRDGIVLEKPSLGQRILSRIVNAFAKIGAWKRWIFNKKAA